ncbi:Baeyer-Villiger monooxygenase [Aspergillus carlsbadensis]|nr:Baeyer-Villiger monooxygenase [Aspergillus carlsbadensis]
MSNAIDDSTISIRGSNGTHKTNGQGSGVALDTEAIVVGAGFSGLRMLLELRKRGIAAKVLEAGSGVGGTWFWNTYPGCRTDCESWVYCMNFSDELCQEWTWKERYAPQSDVRAYLNYVADRFNLRKDITLDTRVTAASFDESRAIWKVQCAGPGDSRASLTCRFLVFATGLLSTAKQIPFAGFDTFEGEWYQTSSWPREAVSCQGKRVAVVGTGSTGVQLIPVVAHVAKSVHVFQRTPNYILPARYENLSQEHITSIKDSYNSIWDRARAQTMGLDMPPAGRVLADVEGDPTAIRRVLDSAYEMGGFGYLFQVFDDLFTNKEANEIMCDYLREKTNAIVKDPKTAALLNPDYPLFTKRPAIGHRYLEAFNKPNVHLVDVCADPIEAVTPSGIRTAKQDYEVDIIIYAIGFDAVTGALTDIDIQGRHGRSLRNEWSKTIDTYQGLTVEGFPNMFMLSGPKSTFANFPMLLASTALEIGKMISFVSHNRVRTIEPSKDAQDRWHDLCEMIFQGTVLAADATRTNSWAVGANIPGKPTGTLYFFGGLPAYVGNIQEESAAGFPSYRFT